MIIILSIYIGGWLGAFGTLSIYNKDVKVMTDTECIVVNAISALAWPVVIPNNIYKAMQKEETK